MGRSRLKRDKRNIAALKLGRMEKVSAKPSGAWVADFAKSLSGTYRSRVSKAHAFNVSPNSGRFNIMLKFGRKNLLEARARVIVEEGTASLIIEQVQGSHRAGSPRGTAHSKAFKKSTGKHPNAALIRAIVDAAYKTGFDSVVLVNIAKNMNYWNPSFTSRKKDEKFSMEKLFEDKMNARKRMRNLYAWLKEEGQFTKDGGKHPKFEDKMKPRKKMRNLYAWVRKEEKFTNERGKYPEVPISTSLNEKFVEYALSVSNILKPWKIMPKLMPFVKSGKPITEKTLKRFFAELNVEPPKFKISVLSHLLNTFREPDYWVREFP
ncbi:MAG: hypothetical protein ABID38_05930 [Candidatus Diapherotrites archaeon]